MAKKLAIGETVTVDFDGPVRMADWQTLPVPPDRGEFRIRNIRDVDGAWAVSTGYSMDVRVVALSCAYCQAHTETGAAKSRCALPTRINTRP